MQHYLELGFSYHGEHFLWLDLIALFLFFMLWNGYNRYALHRYSKQANLMRLTDGLRFGWMEQALRRDNRIVDSTLVGNLLRSISFFANTSIFILLGLFTILGYREEATKILNSIPFALESSPLMWDIKIFLLAYIFIYAFFKYTWSLRQYNYASIYIGAMPFHDERLDEHEEIAARGGRLISNAGQHFNMGLRAYYFGLAATTWFLHPLLFIAATLLVIGVIYRREFRSRAVANLL